MKKITINNNDANPNAYDYMNIKVIQSLTNPYSFSKDAINNKGTILSNKSMAYCGRDLLMNDPNAKIVLAWIPTKKVSEKETKTSILSLQIKTVESENGLFLTYEGTERDAKTALYRTLTIKGVGEMKSIGKGSFGRKIDENKDLTIENNVPNQ